MDAILREFRSLECQCCNRHFGYEHRADGGKTKICGSQCAETFLRRSRSLPRLNPAGMNLSYPSYPPPPSPHVTHGGLMVSVPYTPLNWNMAASAHPTSYQQTPQQSAFCIPPYGYAGNFMQPIPKKTLSRPRSPSPIVCTPSSDGDDSVSRRDKLQPHRRDAAKKPRATDVVDSKKDAKLALTLKEQIKEAMMNDPSIVKIAPLAVAAMIEKSGNGPDDQEEAGQMKPKGISGRISHEPGIEIASDDDSAQPIVCETPKQVSPDGSDTGISKDNEAAANKTDITEAPLSPIFLRKPKAATKFEFSAPVEKQNEPGVDFEGNITDDVSPAKTSEEFAIPKKSHQIELHPKTSSNSEEKNFYDKFETTSYNRKTVRSLLNFTDNSGIPKKVGDDADWVPATSIGISEISGMVEPVGTIHKQSDDADWVPVDSISEISGMVEPVGTIHDQGDDADWVPVNSISISEISGTVEPVGTKNGQAAQVDNGHKLNLKEDEWDDEGPQDEKEETTLPQSMSMLKIISEATTVADDEWVSDGSAASSSYKPLYEPKIDSKPLAKQVLPKEKWLIQDLELSLAFRQNTGVLISWIWDNADFNLHAEADAKNIQKLVDDISAYCKHAAPMEHNPSVGEIVLAPYYGDFYRSVVISSNEENYSIVVEFVDYGDTVEVDVAECFEVPDDIMKKHPVYGLRFSQAFDKPRQKIDLSLEVVEYIKDKNYKILMDPDSSNHDEFHWHGDLQLVSEDNRIVMIISDLFEDPSQLQKLPGKQARQTKKTLAPLAPKSMKASAQLAPIPSTSAPLPKTKPAPAPVRAHPLMTKAPSLAKATARAPVVQSQLEPVPSRKTQDRTESWVKETNSCAAPARPGHDCAVKMESIATRETSKVSSDTNAKTVEGKTLDSMDLSTHFKQGCRVQISFVWNPARLTVNAVADVDGMLNLEAQVAAWVLKAPRLKRFPQEGEVVLAPYDGVYYRAVATTYVSLKLGEAEMKFIDYGDSKKVPLKDLRPMSDEIAAHPVYGLELDIDGIGNVTVNIWNYPQLSKAVRNEYENMTVRRLDEMDPFRWRAELWFDEYDDWTFVVGTALSTLVN